MKTSWAILHFLIATSESFLQVAFRIQWILSNKRCKIKSVLNIQNILILLKEQIFMDKNLIWQFLVYACKILGNKNERLSQEKIFSEKIENSIFLRRVAASYPMLKVTVTFFIKFQNVSEISVLNENATKDVVCYLEGGNCCKCIVWDEFWTLEDCFMAKHGVYHF